MYIKLSQHWLGWFKTSHCDYVREILEVYLEFTQLFITSTISQLLHVVWNQQEKLWKWIWHKLIKMNIDPLLIIKMDLESQRKIIVATFRTVFNVSTKLEVTEENIPYLIRFKGNYFKAINCCNQDQHIVQCCCEQLDVLEDEDDPWFCCLCTLQMWWSKLLQGLAGKLFCISHNLQTSHLFCFMHKSLSHLWLHQIQNIHQQFIQSKLKSFSYFNGIHRSFENLAKGHRKSCKILLLAE